MDTLLGTNIWDNTKIPIVFSVTYYFELRNTITIFYISLFLFFF